MIQQIFEGIANAIIRRPKLVAFFIAAILLLGIYGMTMLSMQTGWKNYVNEDSATGYLQQNIRLPSSHDEWRQFAQETEVAGDLRAIHLLHPGFHDSVERGGTPS